MLSQLILSLCCIATVSCGSTANDPNKDLGSGL
jgi:hypothetical protein